MYQPQNTDIFIQLNIDSYVPTKQRHICTNKTFTLCVPIASATLGAAPIIVAALPKSDESGAEKSTLWVDLRDSSDTPCPDSANTIDSFAQLLLFREESATESELEGLIPGQEEPQDEKKLSSVTALIRPTATIDPREMIFFTKKVFLKFYCGKNSLPMNISKDLVWDSIEESPIDGGFTLHCTHSSGSLEIKARPKSLNLEYFAQTHWLALSHGAVSDDLKPTDTLQPIATMADALILREVQITDEEINQIAMANGVLAFPPRHSRRPLQALRAPSRGP